MKTYELTHLLSTLLTAERSEAKRAAEQLAELLLNLTEPDTHPQAMPMAQRLLLLRGSHAKGACRKKATIRLPVEFVALCKEDGTHPETVLRGFIADLCGLMNWVRDPREDGYSSNGSDERMMARNYYERVGYPWMNRPLD